MLLAFGHGLNDLIAGYFLGVIATQQTGLLQAAISVTIYNLLAFGGQYPVAVFMEKFSKPGLLLVLSYALNIATIMTFFFAPPVAVVLAGIASAIYHVTGGTLCATDNKATNIGLFAAPGVAGLIMGGYFAFTVTNILPALSVISILFFIILFRFLHIKKTAVQKTTQESGTKFSLDRHDYIMILLLLIITMRSAIWNIFQLIHENDYTGLIAIAIAAFSGKIIGGWMADRIGWKLYAMISLALSAPLLTFFKNEILLFSIGIGLLQSGIPATTSLLIYSMKGKTEKAIGLAFGTAILAGAAVLYQPLQSFFFSDIAIAFISLLILVLFLFIRRKQPALKP